MQGMCHANDVVQKQHNPARSLASPSNSVLLPADDAQRELDAALPALDAALASLKNLSKNDVVEVRSLQNPPAGVKLVMEAACIMFDEKPKMKDDPNKMGESQVHTPGRCCYGLLQAYCRAPGKLGMCFGKCAPHPTQDMLATCIVLTTA
jgi:hypothetical protein